MQRLAAKWNPPAGFLPWWQAWQYCLRKLGALEPIAVLLCVKGWRGSKKRHREKPAWMDGHGPYPHPRFYQSASLFEISKERWEEGNPVAGSAALTP